MTAKHTCITEDRFALLMQDIFKENFIMISRNFEITMNEIEKI